MHIEYSIKNANSLFILGETKSVQTRKSLVRMLGGAALSRTNKLTSNWQTDPAPALCTFTPRREWGTRWLSRGGKQMPCSHFKHRIVGAGILSLLVNPFHLKNHYSADLPQPPACSPLKIFRFKFPLHKTWFTFWNFV